jgi:hypothetical protein
MWIRAASSGMNTKIKVMAMALLGSMTYGCDDPESFTDRDELPVELMDADEVVDADDAVEPVDPDELAVDLEDPEAVRSRSSDGLVSR